MKLFNKNSTKSRNSKVISGGVKQRSKIKVVLFSLVAVLVLTTIGFFGYDQYKAHTLKAKASGYKMIYNDGTNTISVCKVQNAFGIYLRGFATKPKSQNGTWFSVATFRSSDTSTSNRVSLRNSQAWWGSTVTALDVFADSHTNWFRAVIYNQQGNYQTTPIYASLAFTPWC